MTIGGLSSNYKISTLTMLFAMVYVLAYVPTIENYIYPDLAPVFVV